MFEPMFPQPGAEVFVPDGSPVEAALRRTTHLGIGAHADDLEFSAWPGINECFGSDDRWFTGIIVTDGAGSPRKGSFAQWTDAKLIEARRAEQRAAAVIGEYSAVVQLAWPSAMVKDALNPGPVNDLAALLSGMQPEVVYLHNPLDRHDTHVATFLRSLAALRAMPRERRPARVLGCEAWRSLDWLVGSDKLSLSAGDRPHVQAALAGVFETQIAGGKRYDLAVQGRRLANATFNDSHATDRESGLVFAIDLTPLVADETLDPLTLSLGYVERLARDVRARIERFQ